MSLVVAVSTTALGLGAEAALEMISFSGEMAATAMSIGISVSMNVPGRR